MRLPWIRPKADQLELLDADPEVQGGVAVADARPAPHPAPVATTQGEGHALLVSVDRLCEDPANPRTEFPEAEIDELAADIRQHGILQPIVVHPADEHGRLRIHFGAKRWRAAQRAGLTEVPVVVRDVPTDPYTQVAENQKRHGLTPRDLARFIRTRVDAGDSRATIAKRLGMDQTTVAHHLALLDLPPELDEAMRAGRCTSPRTLYELSQLHREQPERVRALLDGDADITRCAVHAVRGETAEVAGGPASRHAQSSLLAQANTACGRLERVLDRLAKAEPGCADADVEVLRQRLASLARRLV
jgi:ParB family transcriptional regulator, chromosome partitioning protein